MREDGERLWKLLVRHNVIAYICSHMLAFDVQAHDGVLQIMTSGAGTAHLLPGEYLHCTQVAVDRQGLRYQTLDTSGSIREALSWPVRLPNSDGWTALEQGVNVAPTLGKTHSATYPTLLAFRFDGVCATDGDASSQTWLSAWDDDTRLASLWIGLCGPNNEVTIVLAPVEERSPQMWRGPSLAMTAQFSIQLAIHSGMGPGGLLWRLSDAAPWSSLANSSQWGAERIQPSKNWSSGHDRALAERHAFRGARLDVKWHARLVTLNENRCAP